MAAIPPLSVWPCGTPFGPRPSPVGRPALSRFRDPKPIPLVRRAGRDHPFPRFAGSPWRERDVARRMRHDGVGPSTVLEVTAWARGPAPGLRRKFSHRSWLRIPFTCLCSLLYVEPRRNSTASFRRKPFRACLSVFVYPFPWHRT
jgi:hypothetical protein